MVDVSKGNVNGGKTARKVKRGSGRNVQARSAKSGAFATVRKGHSKGSVTATAVPTKAFSAPKSNSPGEAIEAVKFFDIEGVVNLEGVRTVLGLSKVQLAHTMGLGESSIAKTNRHSSQKVQSRAREMLEILGRIEDWAGGSIQALAWYRSQPIPALDGRTCEQLVKSGQAGPVREYLDHMALGGFA